MACLLLGPRRFVRLVGRRFQFSRKTHSHDSQNDTPDQPIGGMRSADVTFSDCSAAGSATYWRR